VTSLNLFFATLTSLDTATLLDATMIHLDIPTKVLERFSIGFRGIRNVGRPVFWFFFGVNNPKHPDEPVLAQVHNSPFRGNINFRNVPVIRIIRVNQPI